MGDEIYMLIPIQVIDSIMKVF